MGMTQTIFLSSHLHQERERDLQASGSLELCPPLFRALSDPHKTTQCDPGLSLHGTSPTSLDRWKSPSSSAFFQVGMFHDSMTPLGCWHWRKFVPRVPYSLAPFPRDAPRGETLGSTSSFPSLQPREWDTNEGVALECWGTSDRTRMTGHKLRDTSGVTRVVGHE